MSSLTDLSTFCLNHPQIQGIYFILEQPWLRFCSQCALNMALNGKKIQKQLSPQEFENKTKINQIFPRIKQAITNADLWHREIGELAKNIQRETKNNLQHILSSFHQFFTQLCKFREEIVEVYEENFTKQSQHLYERQTNILLAQINLKKQIEYIEQHFSKLVQNKCEESCIQKINNIEFCLKQIDENRLENLEKQIVIEKLENRKKQIIEKIKNQPTFNYEIQVFEKNEKRGEKNRRSTLIGNQYDESLISQSKVKGRTITVLKLRSKSKKKQNRIQKGESSRRKSIRDISNLVKLTPFQL